MIDREAGRRRIQNELGPSQRRVFTIINFLTEPTFAIDRSGTHITGNQTGKNLTGTGALMFVLRGLPVVFSSGPSHKAGMMSMPEPRFDQKPTRFLV